MMREAVEPARVDVKIGSSTLSTADDVPAFEVKVINNVNKGKATVIITPTTGSTCGGKVANFSIVARSLKGLSFLGD